MKSKVKQMVCMVCAFVLSFMLTVTAFADTKGFDYYVGIYNCQNGPGHITLSSDFLFYLVIYCDNNKDCYVGASRGEGRLIAGEEGFNVLFPTAIKTTSSGALPVPAYRETFLNYRATGKVTKLTKTKIYSHQSNKIYSN